jgi:amidase
MLARLSAAVRSGDLHPRSLVESALDRIAQHNGPLNAVTQVRAKDALAEADRHPRTGALAGLPVLVKDLVDARGTRNTYGGMAQFAEAPISEDDDPTVKALVDAGAIVVGRTNSPAMGHLGITTNQLFGPTRNCWNLDRTPSGSSGGAAVALAAGLAAICTSSDGGGSTRAPAALCGLVGWKPSAGLVRRSRGSRSMFGSSSVGALGVSVADCLLEAVHLIGVEPGDLMAPPAGSVSLSPKMPSSVLACHSLTGRSHPAIAAAFERLVSAIIGAGVAVETVASPVGPEAVDCFEHVYNAELALSLEAQRAHWDELEASLRWLAEQGELVSVKQLLHAQQQRYELALQFDRLLGQDTVLLVPTLNILPPGPGVQTGPGSLDPETQSMLEAEMAGAANTMHFNMSGHPAINVPMGIDPDGVPIGLQIVAPRWRDDLAFGLAAWVETIAPWPRSAPGYSEFGSDQFD